jgi:WD40 repeat protein
MLVAGGDDDNLFFWDASEAKIRFQKKIPAKSKGVWDIAFNPNGDTFASGGRDGTVAIWRSNDLGSEPSRLTTTASHGQVSSISIGSDGSTLVAGYNDGTVIVWNMNSGAQMGEPIKHGTGVSQIALSPDLKLIAAGGTGEPLAFWDAGSRVKLQTLPLTDYDSVNALLFTPDDHFLIAVQGDYCLLWSVSEADGLNHVLTGHTQKVWARASDRAGTMLASGDRDGSVLLWDATTRQRLDPPLKLSHSYVKALAFDPIEKRLAVGHDDGIVTLWNLSDHQQIGAPLHFHTKSITKLTYSQDGRYLASGSADGGVAIHDVQAARTSTRYEHDDAISGLDFSSDGRLLVSSSAEGKIILWDVGLNKESRSPIDTKPEDARRVRFSPDGKQLVWFDGTKLVLWKLDSPLQQRSYLKGRVGTVNSIAFSPDGRFIIGSTMEHEVVMWDVSLLQRLPRALQGHTEIVWEAIFLGDRGVIASTGNDLSVRLWDANAENRLSRACEIANRNFTEDEWAQYLGSEQYRKTCLKIP